MADASLAHLPALDLGLGLDNGAGPVVTEAHATPPAPTPTPAPEPVPAPAPVLRAMPPLLPPLVPNGAPTLAVPVLPPLVPIDRAGPSADAGYRYSAYYGIDKYLDALARYGKATTIAKISDSFFAIGFDTGTVVLSSTFNPTEAVGVFRNSGAGAVLKIESNVISENGKLNLADRVVVIYANGGVVSWIPRRDKVYKPDKAPRSRFVDAEAVDARIDAGAVSYHCRLERLGGDELARAGFAPAALVYGWRAPAGHGGIAAALGTPGRAHVHVHDAAGAALGTVGGDALVATEFGAAGSNGALAVRLVGAATATDSGGAIVVHLAPNA